MITAKSSQDGRNCPNTLAVSAHACWACTLAWHGDGQLGWPCGRESQSGPLSSSGQLRATRWQRSPGSPCPPCCAGCVGLPLRPFLAGGLRPGIPAGAGPLTCSLLRPTVTRDSFFCHLQGFEGKGGCCVHTDRAFISF